MDNPFLFSLCDDFFPSAKTFRETLLGLNYEGTVSPFDGVLYPGIAEVPLEMQTYLTLRVSTIVGRVLKPSVIFARLSVQGVKAPHQAHTDKIMGSYTAIVYANTPYRCRGGTAILRHRPTGLARHPYTRALEEQCQADSNDKSKWETLYTARMKFNRAFVCDSELFHRSHPIGGFGNSVKNGRLVLVGFFNPV